MQKKLHRKVVFITKSFSPEFYYLKDQLRRSSLSVVLLIAEGSAKTSDRDFNRYIEMAMGSGSETFAGLDIAFTEQLISEIDYQETIILCEDIVRQLGGFSKKLKVGG